MAKTCDVCGKTVSHGHKISHSNIKTNRTFAPNIQTVRVNADGRPRRMNVCTACLRSGKVTRA